MIAEYQVRIGDQVLFFNALRVMLPTFHRQGDESARIVQYEKLMVGNPLLHPDWDAALWDYSIIQRMQGQLFQRT